MTIKLELTRAQCNRAAELLYELIADKLDDGRDENEDTRLLSSLARSLTGAAKGPFISNSREY